MRIHSNHPSASIMPAAPNVGRSPHTAAAKPSTAVAAPAKVAAAKPAAAAPGAYAGAGSLIDTHA
jgi:hypothetical protein